MQQEKLTFETFLGNSTPQTEVVNQLNQKTEAVLDPRGWIAAGLAVASIYSGYNVVQPDTAQAKQTSSDAFADPANLPGIHDVVDTQTREKIKDSTVIIVKQETQADGSKKWRHICTGMRRSAVASKEIKNDLISTASHCFKEELGFSDLTPVALSGSANSVALNYIDQLQSKYAISAPESIEDPIALVKGVSMMQATDYSTRDTALLEVEPLQSSNQSEPHRSFQQIKPIPYLSYEKHQKKLPKVGAQVAMYGNQIVNTLPQAGTGIFLGTALQQRENSIQQVYAVGVRAKTIEKNLCFYSRSGSSVISKSGYVFGPQSTWSSTLNPKYLKDWGYIRTAAHLKIEKDNIRTQRIEYQNQLGIKLGGFTTICFYNAQQRDDTKVLLAGLEKPSLQAVR